MADPKLTKAQKKLLLDLGKMPMSIVDGYPPMVKLLALGLIEVHHNGAYSTMYRRTPAGDEYAIRYLG